MRSYMSQCDFISHNIFKSHNSDFIFNDVTVSQLWLHIQPTWVLLLTMSIPSWLQCTHLLMYFQQDNAPCHKAQIISDWFLEHNNEFTLLKWPPHSPDLNPIEHLWDVVEREIHGCAADKSAATVWFYHVNMDQNLIKTLLNLSHEEIRQFWRQKGVQSDTSKVYLIKWAVNVSHKCDYISQYDYMYHNWLSISKYHYISHKCDYISNL